MAELVDATDSKSVFFGSAGSSPVIGTIKDFLHTPALPFSTFKIMAFPIIELKDHPWFVGCQFHPELKSRVDKAHPLFREFVKASLKNSKN